MNSGASTSASDTDDVLDISPFTSGGTPERRTKLAAQLHQRLSINGWAPLKGHGLSAELIEEAFDATKTLFDLPYEQKKMAPHPDAPVPHRGYSGPDRESVAAKTANETSDYVERAVYSTLKDIKETFEIGSEENEEEKNIWLPEEVYPGFRSFALRFYWAMDEVAKAVLAALLSSLDLEDGEAQVIFDLHPGVEHQLRFAHYPPVDEPSKVESQASRLGAHRDWSTFTLLLQDSNGGLQFHDQQSDSFIDAQPRENVIFLNIGDKFQTISNGVYPSALHRVVVRHAARHRYSIPFFVVPKYKGIIEPLPSQMKAVGKRRFEPFVSMEYSTAMFETTNVYD